MAEFVGQLGAVNSLADASPGFIWRLRDEDPNDPGMLALAETLVIPPSRLLINLSVWRDAKALSDFVFRSAHAQVMRRRNEWFAPLSEASVVLWWVAAGVIPTLTEAGSRLQYLRAHGASAQAFTFRSQFAPQVSE